MPVDRLVDRMVDDNDRKAPPPKAFTLHVNGRDRAATGKPHRTLPLRVA